MAKKHKPKWGWENGGFYPFDYFSDKDFQTIAGALNIPQISEEIQSHLQNAIRHYFSDKHYITGVPNPAEVRAALTAVRDNAKALMDSLEQLDARSLESLVSTKALTVPERHTLLDRQSDATRIHAAAKEALEKRGQDKGGRPKEKAILRAFIAGLRPIFEEITRSNAILNSWPINEKTYHGPFYNFIHTILEIKDPGAIWSNSALGQNIKQALRTAPELGKQYYSTKPTL